MNVGVNDELLSPTIQTDGGPWVKHNMPCAVNLSEHAVYDLSLGVFLPSWNAQRDGWMLVKPPKWLRWFFKYYIP